MNAILVHSGYYDSVPICHDLLVDLLATFPLSCCFITYSYPFIWQIEHKYVPIHPSQYTSIRSSRLQFSNDFAKVGLEDLASGCFG